MSLAIDLSGVKTRVIFDLNLYVIGMNVLYNGKTYTIYTTVEGKHVLTDHDQKLDGKKFYIKKGIVYSGNVPLHRTLISRRALFLDGIATDCRKANLSPFKYIPSKSKEYRNNKLPVDCGVSPEEVPAYMWYDPQRNYWVIKIKNKFHWKSSSSPEISIKCKFEMGKKVYRNLMEVQPLLFSGETPKDEKLENEYYEIFKLAGIAIPRRKNPDLQQDLSGLTEDELQLIADLVV